MAKLVYGLNQSLDGYVDHLEFRPNPALFRHFIEHVRDLTGIVYGRRMYEIMRYWDEDHADWVAEEHDFAAAWRNEDYRQITTQNGEISGGGRSKVSRA
jgi:hypothetical protein